MLTKNKQVPVATVAVALITGLMVVLWLALMPASAQAQSGDVLELLRIEAKDITGDEGGIFGDFTDEPYILVEGEKVWSGRMDKHHVISLRGTFVPLSGDNVKVQLWERDPGTFNKPDDLIGEFSAEFTNGAEKTEVLSETHANYVITYRVDRPPPVDNDPPETVISSGPVGTVLSNQATFEFHADESSTFQCKLDGGVFEPCSSPKQYLSLSFGTHTFQVKATDGAGNADPTPAMRQWTAQKNTPPAVGPVKPAPGSTTRDRTPVISAVVRDAQTNLIQSNIKLTVDGRAKSFAYDAVSDKLLRQSNKLAFGKHTVKVEATDAQGLKATKAWTFKVVK